MQPSSRKRAGARVVGIALGAVVLAASHAAAGDIEYNRDIRPILSENCFACHGPDSASRKADLRLDRREQAIAAEAIVPSDAENSDLVFRVETDDADTVMPPPSTGKTLTAGQKALLRKWVDAGAEYQPHWSFIPPARPALPPVKAEGWVRNPIDRFILARLEAAGLAPAPEADRRTLARRVALDLTGLPPEPALVEAFVKDNRPDAYERLVEELLRSPAWGEHRARAWLDAARYADTHGFHFDNFREMWSYRDWVIDAFNKNVPFDRFTVEQLAGDLLPNRTLEQQVASGFNRCNMTTNEGGTIPEEYLVLYTRDRVETVGQVWLGLTAGCAVCHDHKFDPLSQKEFYSLAAFFNNTTQNAMDGNIKDTPPTVVVPRADDRARWDALAGELADLDGKIQARREGARPEFDAWLRDHTPEALAGMAPADGLRLAVKLNDREGTAAPLTFESADAGDCEKDQPFTVSAWVRLGAEPVTGPIVSRMDESKGYRGWDLWVDRGRLGAHLVHEWPDDGLKVVTTAEIPRGRWAHVAMSYDGSGKASGLTFFLDGVRQEAKPATEGLKGSIRSEAPLRVGRRSGGPSRIDGLLVGEVRVYRKGLGEGEVGTLVAATQAADLRGLAEAKRPKDELDGLYSRWIERFDPASTELVAKKEAAGRERDAIRARGTIAHVAQERSEPAMAYLLFRGDYDKRRDPVTPATPAMFPPFPSDLPKNRLGLAQWLLRPEHPLTARVTVNRAWQEVFGTGLVRSAGDFGISGELPSHPELLDWLAVQFREGGWDVKDLFRLMVTSATYRQAATATPEKIQKDAPNRLLSRGPRFRMEAEMVRDYALAASGLLNRTLGGPSVKPYQPGGVWEAVAMPESNTKAYRADEGGSLYRRSLYTFWKRAAPPASMEIFNAPSRETCTVRRERSNTPLQALVTLNDPQFVEAARALAERAVKGASEPAARIDFLAEAVLCRPLRDSERPVVEASLATLRSYYDGHAEDAAKLVAVGESKADPALDAKELAAWTMLANQILNLDEALNK
jgi:cytochrome c553